MSKRTADPSYEPEFAVSANVAGAAARAKRDEVNAQAAVRNFGRHRR
jgi:hypothetical protein